MMKKPETLETRICYRAKNWRIEEDTLRLPGGALHVHATLVHPGAVVVLPVTSNGNLLLLRQYRHSFRDFILEFPAGTLGNMEDPLECARREIIEETGYAAKNWRSLGRLYPAPGFCNEIQYCFLADTLEKAEGFADEDEIISVEEVSVETMEDLILNGKLHDSKSISSFLLARLKKLI